MYSMYAPDYSSRYSNDAPYALRNAHTVGHMDSVYYSRQSPTVSTSRPLIAPSTYVANAYSSHAYTGTLSRHRPSSGSTYTPTHRQYAAASTSVSRSTSVDRYAAARNVDALRSQFERSSLASDDGYSSTSTTLARRLSSRQARYQIDEELESADVVSSLPSSTGRYRTAASTYTGALSTSPSMPDVTGANGARRTVTTSTSATSFDRHQPSRASQSSTSTSSSSGCVSSDSRTLLRRRSPSPTHSAMKTTIYIDADQGSDDGCGQRGLANIGNTVS